MHTILVKKKKKKKAQVYSTTEYVLCIYHSDSINTNIHIVGIHIYIISICTHIILNTTRSKTKFSKMPIVVISG